MLSLKRNNMKLSVMSGFLETRY